VKRLLVLVAAAALGASRPSPLSAQGVARASAGPYEVALHLPPAGLYAGEEMEIEFRVDRADRSAPGGGPLPLTWARIEAVVDMPSMPSMARFDEIAHGEGVPGLYGVHPTFPHGGDYRLCLTILPPEVQPIGDPRPAEPFTVEFPLTVFDATSSPTRESAKVKPFALDVISTPRHPVAGEPVELEIRVRLTGSFEQREVVDFDVQHERLMHVFVVSEDLTEFSHEHPEPAGPGVFRLTRRFSRPGRYRVFVDVAPRDAGAQVLAASLVVGGQAPAGAPAAAPPADTRVALDLPPGGVPVGRTVIVTAILTDAKGRPVRDLEPWLGAVGHLMLVHEDATTFAHAHPDDRERGVGKDGRIPFLVRLPKPGPYKGWLQIERRGKIETIEIALEAQRPAPGT
jgi:YtkA-like